MLENYNVLFGGKVIAIHQDYFGLFDLISFCDGRYYFHQISNLENKAAKVKAIEAKNKQGQKPLVLILTLCFDIHHGTSFSKKVQPVLSLFFRDKFVGQTFFINHTKTQKSGGR